MPLYTMRRRLDRIRFMPARMTEMTSVWSMSFQPFHLKTVKWPENGFGIFKKINNLRVRTLVIYWTPHKSKPSGATKKFELHDNSSYHEVNHVYFDKMDQKIFFELRDNSRHTTSSYAEFTLERLFRVHVWTRPYWLESNSQKWITHRLCTPAWHLTARGVKPG